MIDEHWITPVSLSENIVRLEPLGENHIPGLGAGRQRPFDLEIHGVWRPKQAGEYEEMGAGFTAEASHGHRSLFYRYPSTKWKGCWIDPLP